MSLIFTLVTHKKGCSRANPLWYLSTKDFPGMQTHMLSKRASSAISGLRQVRSLVPLTTALTINNSLIQPIFDYCDVVWDDLPITSAQRLQKLQNRSARVITQQGYDIRSNELRNMLEWDNLEQRRDKHKAIMMHKTLNNLAPDYRKELFNQSYSSNNYNLRKASLALPMPKTEFMKKSFKYSGDKLWNDLPDNVKCVSNPAHFKRKLSSLCHVTTTST